MSLSETSKELSSIPASVFLKPCSTCGASSKYCCPACACYSCSAACVQSHKSKTDCDGIRIKTAFVAVEEFNDSNLQSDYHFLEEINRSISNASRFKKDQGYFHYLPQNLYRLKIAAKSRRTDLQILPVMFSKRKGNTTYLRYMDRKIFWRVEWCFSQIELSCFDERIDEDIMLGSCLDKYLFPEQEGQHSSLLYYQSMGHNGVVVLLKNDRSAAQNANYFMLNQKKSLKKNFAQKRIIEYPTLLVVPKIHLSAYPLVEIDDTKKEKEIPNETQ